MIISNATPLIAFARIGQMSLFQKVVGSVVIPEAVAREISEYAKNRQGVIDVSQENWISIQAVQSEQQARLLLPTLDRGEAEVITLALERQTRLVLIDELTGRKVAESLNLNVSGSVGILIRAKQMGEIPAIQKAFEVANRADLTREELEDLEHQEIYIQDQRNATIKAVKQAISQAKKEKAIDIAKGLLDVLDEATIAQTTGLSIEEIQKLKQAR